MAEERGRQLAVELLRDELNAPLQVRIHAQDRLYLIEIVRACAALPHGLRALGEVLDSLEPGSSATVETHRLIDEWYASGWISGEDWSLLREALEGVTLPDLADLCRLATESRVPMMPAHCDCAWWVFVHLAGFNAGPHTLPPSLVFLDLLLDRLEPSAADAVREVCLRWAREWGLAAELEVRHWRRPLGESAVDAAYLVIELDPDGLDSQQYTLSHWYQNDPHQWHPRRGEDRTVRLGELEQAVENLIADMEAKWARSSAPVMLEFVLPWELLNSEVDWWPHESGTGRASPLAMDYSVVVRSLERLRTPRWHRLWRQRWRQFVHEPATSHMYWSRPSGEDYFTRLESELKSDESTVSLVLSEPPQHTGGHARKEIETALRSGLPIIIWHRGDCSSAEFRTVVSSLAAEGGLGSLPERVRKLRMQALRLEPDQRGRHIGRHLTVLWDDPERLPEPSDPAFEELRGGRR
ncbi:MAG: effector-associated domain 2-containing protein [Mycobacteriales bacterium]